ncbi:2-hydroxycarboxylate transporter family protein [Tissierella sp.]|uniref:2-hydroxycarboxylate transporter family protein n=1 Tax=Tissierella sp. TaxID=41274 RepID=UPI0028A7E04C|nr:2-hydroxycarboxylate transporter family protein [Tissierella sp.]
MSESTLVNQQESVLKRKLYGMPIWMLILIVGIVYIATFTGKMPDDDMLSIIGIMFSLGIVLYEVGERIPIWKDYLGGGSLLAFLGGAALEYYEILPVKYSEGITFFYDDYGFQTVFISLLIVSAVLAVNRRQLLKAFKGYVPAIFGGIIAAAIFGLIGGLLVGVDVKSILTLYVLPTMGGGNGAGAIPLSEMWEATTGQSKDAFYSQAIAILTLANNFAILGAVALNSIGKKYPNLTGNGELLKNAEVYLMDEDKIKKEKKEITQFDMAGGLLLTCAIYAMSRLFSKSILPAIGPVTLHMYAYMVIFSALANVSNIIPDSIKQGTKKLSSFFTGPLMGMCMVGIGIAFTDLGELIGVLNVKTLVICAFVIIGAIIGAGLVGMLFGFYFVESAITAGLCMANRGGSGDLQVLGAAKRMQLMSYAQISSRIGGAIILLIGSVVFSFYG